MTILIGWLKRKWKVIVIVLLLISVHLGYSKWDDQNQLQQIDGSYTEVKGKRILSKKIEINGTSVQLEKDGISTSYTIDKDEEHISNGEIQYSYNYDHDRLTLIKNADQGDIEEYVKIGSTEYENILKSGDKK